MSHYLLNGYILNNVLVPKEILLKIFKHLPVSDFQNCSNTCKVWDDIILDRGLWIKKFQEKFSFKPSVDVDDYMIRLLVRYDCSENKELIIPMSLRTSEYVEDLRYLYGINCSLKIKNVADLHNFIESYKPNIIMEESIELSQVGQPNPQYLLNIDMKCANQTINIVHDETTIYDQILNVRYVIPEYPNNVEEIAFSHSLDFNRTIETQSVTEITQHSGSLKFDVKFALKN